MRSFMNFWITIGLLSVYGLTQAETTPPPVETPGQIEKTSGPMTSDTELQLSRTNTSPNAPDLNTLNDNQEIVVQGVGYGTMNQYAGYPPEQRRLLAMRASKAEAYRALAEQLYGVRITGSTTISSMVAYDDTYRVKIDTILRGAHMVSGTPLPDGNYKTVVELRLTRKMREALLNLDRRLVSDKDFVDRTRPAPEAQMTTKPAPAMNKEPNQFYYSTNY